MRTRPLILFAGIAAVLTALIACSMGPSLMSHPMPQSGFLSNYELLQHVPDTPRGTRVWRYRNASVNPNAYTAVMVYPVYMNQQAGKNISQEALDGAKDALQEAMIQAIKDKGNIRFVSNPGPGVARISTGITGAEANANGLKPWNFTPIGLAASAAQYAAGVNAKTPALVVESEITDSQTNSILGKGLIVIEGDSFRTNSSSIKSFVGMAKTAVVEALKLSAGSGK